MGAYFYVQPQDSCHHEFISRLANPTLTPMENQLKNMLAWPELNFNHWKNTLATVHLWTQIVGKIRLTKMPWVNHSWHVTLYVSPKGLTTGSVPYAGGIFEIEFDFLEHKLDIILSTGQRESVALRPQPVKLFYEELFSRLHNMGIEAQIYASPNEVENAVPFQKDEEHRSYDPAMMQNFWRALVSVNKVFTEFRSRFSGKCSPVHFFWGAFDLAVTRFSGKTAPKHPGGAPNMPDVIMQEAYSHEVSSCGFWPGSEQSPHAVFYSYCYPTPASFGQQVVEPEEAFFSQEMGEYFLPYDVVRQSANPEATLLKFLESTYEAAAQTGNWDRKALEFNFKPTTS